VRPISFNSAARLVASSALLFVALVVAGCGGNFSSTLAANSVTLESRSLVAGASAQPAITDEATGAVLVDTNGALQWSAAFPDGTPAQVEWSVTGGDPHAGPGSITSTGLYTPPSYTTADPAEIPVIVHARLPHFHSDAATARILLIPGFLRPLAPENLSLTANGSATLTGSIAQVGGDSAIRFSLATSIAAASTAPASATADLGTLSNQQCTRGAFDSPNPAYTVCSVTYTAPAVVPAPTAVYILGSVETTAQNPVSNQAANPVPRSAVSLPTARSWTLLLLNNSGINSNPIAHQQRLALPVPLGSSSGSNHDYDTQRGQLTDCCGGTLGALLQDSSGNQYALSNNHVLARSDQSQPGETVIQPALIDNGCTPVGSGPGATQVATLAAYPPLDSPNTNVDAALARVTPGAVDPHGAILELGAKLPDGSLDAAAPGVSSTAGQGESAALGMLVAKSGRTTGLTCAPVSAVSLDVLVDYYQDCAETKHALRKKFTNQIAISGTSFSDAGDSGALVVDTSNAEPVGLFFAGGTDSHGIEHAIANPVSDVLANLEAQLAQSGGNPSPSAARLAFVGAADHPVACLRYPATTPSASPLPTLTPAQQLQADRALALAQQWANSPSNAGNSAIRVSITNSLDHPGSPAIFIDSAYPPVNLPREFAGLPTQIASLVPGYSQTPPARTDPAASATTPQPAAAALARAIQVKQRRAAELFQSNPAIFGVGVGLSHDNPADPAILLLVDQSQPLGALPTFLDRERVRILPMDRLHVTRAHAHARPSTTNSACHIPPQSTRPNSKFAHELSFWTSTLRLPR